MSDEGDSVFTKEFWKRTAERAIKTFAQAFVATGIVVGATSKEWQAAALAAVIAAGLSVVTSIASTSVGEKGSPSLLDPAPLEPGVTPPGPNFDSTDFGPAVIDPKDVA